MQRPSRRVANEDEAGGLKIEPNHGEIRRIARIGLVHGFMSVLGPFSLLCCIIWTARAAVHQYWAMMFATATQTLGIGVQLWFFPLVKSFGKGVYWFEAGRDRYMSYLLRTIVNALAFGFFYSRGWMDEFLSFDDLDDRHIHMAVGGSCVLFSWWVMCPRLFAAVGVLKSAHPPDPLRQTVTAYWNPFDSFGLSEKKRAWLFVVVRIVNSSIFVALSEELYFRYFLTRFLTLHLVGEGAFAESFSGEHAEFTDVPLNYIHIPSIFISALMFGSGHLRFRFEWVSGLLFGFGMQALTIWSESVIPAVVAHGLTNFYLGIWVVTTQEWHHW